MREFIGRSDILMMTLDSLRYDAAQRAFEEGRLPVLGPYLGPRGWERRHTPASFTYAAHHAFLAGFLPTPLGSGPHPRLFAAEFAGSLSTTEASFTFTEPTLPQALSARGYRTVCVGGTGFFSRQNELSRVLPGLFGEAYWSPELGVACPQSPANQVAQAIEAVHGQERAFLFINVAAIHQPNWFYGAAAGPDTLHTHTAALEAVDRALEPLFAHLQRRGPTFAIVCSDHGTAYGEDGYTGHRCGHEVVWTVPYAEFVL